MYSTRKVKLMSQDLREFRIQWKFLPSVSSENALTEESCQAPLQRGQHCVTVFLSCLLEFPAVGQRFLNRLVGTTFGSHAHSHPRGRGRTIHGDNEIAWVKSVCYTPDGLAGVVETILHNLYCPLNALLFTQSKPSMAHKKYICCFIYYLPDMLLATRVGNRLRTQFLRETRRPEGSGQQGN